MYKSYPMSIFTINSYLKLLFISATHFLKFFTKYFDRLSLKNPAMSLYDDYIFASSCKKSENFYEPISRKAGKRRTYVRTFGGTQVNL